MKVQMLGCSHHNAAVEIRERLAFSPDQTPLALAGLQQRFPGSEAVLLSTCNRVELYLATEQPAGPTHHDLVEFVADFHGLNAAEIFDDLFERTGEDAVRHLFTVAASLDSMVIGEAQILSQVKQAYETAQSGDTAGPLLNMAFQSAIRVAKRVATETRINERRVSIPSVAVADFASQIFQRFDNKRVLVIGAGEMGQETLRYLINEGVSDISIVNRSLQRARELSERIQGEPRPWDELHRLLAETDLVVSTTGATEPIVSLDDFREIVRQRAQRPLFVLDLAVPRDFAAEVGDLNGVFLYSVDDLKEACKRNRKAREKEWPKAERIIDDETAKFLADLNHRATAPTIRRLKSRANDVKMVELARLLNKLEGIDEKHCREIERSFDRVVNKLLHPPLESLRDEAEQGSPHGLMEALVRLFKLKD